VSFVVFLPFIFCLLISFFIFICILHCKIHNTPYYNMYFELCNLKGNFGSKNTFSIVLSGIYFKITFQIIQSEIQIIVNRYYRLYNPEVITGFRNTFLIL